MTPEKLSQLVYAYRKAHNILASVMTYSMIANKVLADIETAKGLLNASDDPTLEEQEHHDNVVKATLQNELSEWRERRDDLKEDLDNVDTMAEALEWTFKQKTQYVHSLTEKINMCISRMIEINERLGTSEKQ